MRETEYIERITELSAMNAFLMAALEELTKEKDLGSGMTEIVYGLKTQKYALKVLAMARGQ